MIKPPAQGSSGTPPEGPEGEPIATPENAASSESSELGDAVGRGLKSLFDSVAAEPVPDKLRQLIEELERKSSKTK
jgi:anti-sigma factor NepR-like protein